jgi:hypothetical protein
MDAKPMHFGCSVILFAGAGLPAFLLVVELLFASRALSAEAKVLQVGPWGGIPIYPTVTTGARGVLIRCDKLPHDAIVEWHSFVENPPHPGDRVAILYEADIQRIGPDPRIVRGPPIDPGAPISELDLQIIRTSGVRFNSFWQRYSVPLFLLVSLWGIVHLASGADIVRYLRAKWRGRRESGKRSAEPSAMPPPAPSASSPLEI